MRLAISRRNAYLLASVALIGGLLPLVGGSRFSLGSTSALVSPAEPVSPAKKNKPPVADNSHARKQPRPGELTPAAARLLMALANRTSDASHADDLFASRSWYVPPPPPPPPPPAAPVEPTAPPLPYIFVGSYTESDRATVYFLTRGDRVYDVRIGDTLDGIYSVDAVQNGALVFTYKPLNTRQTLELGGGT